MGDSKQSSQPLGSGSAETYTPYNGTQAGIMQSSNPVVVNPFSNPNFAPKVMSSLINAGMFGPYAQTGAAMAAPIAGAIGSAVNQTKPLPDGVQTQQSYVNPVPGGVETGQTTARLTAYGYNEPGAEKYGTTAENYQTARVNPLTGKSNATAGFTVAGPRSLLGNYVQLPDNSIRFVHDVGGAVESRKASGGKNMVLDIYSGVPDMKSGRFDMGTGNVKVLGASLTPEQIDQMNIPENQKQVLRRRMGYFKTMVANY